MYKPWKRHLEGEQPQLGDLRSPWWLTYISKSRDDPPFTKWSLPPENQDPNGKDRLDQPSSGGWSNHLGWSNQVQVMGWSIHPSRWILNFGKPTQPTLLPRSLTWNLKISPWKRRFLLETHHFQVPAVSFRGCKSTSYLRVLGWSKQVLDLFCFVFSWRPWFGNWAFWRATCRNGSSCSTGSGKLGNFSEMPRWEQVKNQVNYTPGSTNIAG